MVVLLWALGCGKSQEDSATAADETTESVATGTTDSAAGGTDSDTTLSFGDCIAPDNLPVDPLELSEAMDIQAAGGPLPTHLVDLEIDEAAGRAYGVGYGGFFAFDISGDALAFLGVYSDPEEIFRLEILSADLVVAASREYGFRIMDVSDPERGLRHIGQASLEGASGMASRDDRLYVVTHLGELVTYDLEDPTQPTEIHRTDGLGNAWEIVLSGDYAYVADNTLGVVTVDLSAPDAPTVLGSAEAAGGVQDIDVDGGVLYAAAGSGGVEIFDLTDPASPQSLAVQSYGSPVISVSAAGDILWAANQESVIALDVSDPANPISLAAQVTDEWAMHVAASQTSPSVYLADWGYLERYALDADARSPSAEVSREVVYLVEGDSTVELSLSNHGAGDLVLSGFSVDDDRFTVEADRAVIPPGEAAAIALTFAEDGAAIEAELCLATNDPESPLLSVSLSSTSNTGSSIAVGEPAINFVLPDLEGELHELNAQLGKPVLMAYFTTW